MKKIEMLGKILSRDEQRMIKGGPIDPEKKCNDGNACTTDSQCNFPQYNCVCGITTTDPNMKCYSSE